MVERRDDDLVARAERRPDAPTDVEGQARHVLAELDLVRARGAQEVGDRGVGLIDDGVGQLARRERATGVGVAVAVVGDDGVDDALRDLGPAGPVEEDDRAAVLLTGECREFRPEGIDIEGGHRVSWISVGNARAYRKPAIPRRRVGPVLRPQLVEAAPLRGLADERDIGVAEVVALEQERLVSFPGEGIREAIAVVQAGAMSAALRRSRDTPPWRFAPAFR